MKMIRKQEETSEKPQIFSLTIDERLQVIANLIVDRIIEEQTTDKEPLQSNGEQSPYE